MTDRAWEYLTKARASRASGDFDGCVRFACVAAYHAERDRLPEILYHSHACVGRAHLLRNEPELARGWFRNATEIAASCVPFRYAPSLHDLFLCYRDTDPDRARGIADSALRLFGSSHPLLQRFRADLSVFQEPVECRWSRFAPLLSSEYSDDVRVLALTNLMEAAEAAKDTQRLCMFWNSLSDTLRARESHEGSALSLLAAAKVLLRPETMLEGMAAARWCAALADERGEDVIADEARYLLSYAN